MHWPSIAQTSHIGGMLTLVRLRGGLHGMNMDRHIQRVVAWADTLHATTHNSLPQLEIAQCATHDEMQRLKNVMGQHQYFRVLRQDGVPKYFQKMFENLQALAIAKSLLRRKAVSNLQELRLIFSSLLFATEHRILELGHTAASKDGAHVEVVKAAALIFALHGLRDIAITAAFFDILIQRLRNGLDDVIDHVLKFPDQAYISNELAAAPFLLWLCINGWKASSVKARQADRNYFVEKAAVLCEKVRIDSVEELRFQSWRMIPTVENYETACDDLWVDINTRTALRDIRQT